MRSRKGILLLEVMVAIIVITSGLLFVMRVYSTAKEAISRSREFFRYSLLLEEKMFDFEERGVIEEGGGQDRFPDLKDYSWQVKAEPLDPEGQLWGDLCAVRLDVSCRKDLPGSGPPTKYSLFTYLFKEKT